MKKTLFISIILNVFFFNSFSQEINDLTDQNRLAVLWTSGDKEVAEKVCMMYTHAAKTNEWFDEVVFIIWGPSSKLLTEDKDLQTKVKAMMDDGVIVEACIACAGLYGIIDDLRSLGMEVKPMGEPLSGFLKDPNTKVLTF